MSAPARPFVNGASPAATLWRVAPPADLPFLRALSWFDARYRELSPLEMLQRYESGWRHRGVLGELGDDERVFLRALVRQHGSVISVDE